MICRSRNSPACGFLIRCSSGRQSAQFCRPERVLRYSAPTHVGCYRLIWNNSCRSLTGRRSSTPGNCADVYPAILQHEKHGEEARKLFADAQKLLEKIVAGKLLQPRGVYGFFPANRVGDDVELYTDESRAKVLATFHFLRQQIAKDDGTPELVPGGFCGAEKLSTLNAQLSTSTDYLVRLPSPAGTGWMNWSKNSRPTTTITMPSWPRRWPTGWRRRLRNSCIKRVREEWGYGKT